MKTEILGVKSPKKQCTDRNCPFHGQLNVKKELARGTIVSKDAHHSAAIEWKRSYYIPKYERYELRKSKIRVHNPPCIDAQVGQEVIAARTRPLSKTKNHVILQVAGKEKISSKESSSKKTKKKSKVEEISEKSVSKTKVFDDAQTLGNPKNADFRRDQEHAQAVLDKPKVSDEKETMSEISQKGKFLSTKNHPALSGSLETE